MFFKLNDKTQNKEFNFLNIINIQNTIHVTPNE